MDFSADFDIDISQVRGAFGEVKKLADGSGKAMAGALSGNPAANMARNAKGQFQQINQAAQKTAGEMAKAETRTSRFYAALRGGAVAVGGVLAIIGALVALNRKFPAIGQVAGQTFGMVRNAASGAASGVAKFFSGFFSNLPKMAKAATIIFGVTRAYMALRKAMTDAAAVPTPKTPRMPSAGGGFGGMLKPLALGAGLALGGVGLFSAVKDNLGKAISSAAEAEQVEISFEVLAGGMAPAKAALADIRQLAANTPLRFPDLAGAGRSLLAFGEGTGQLGDTLRRIGDIASGVRAPIGDIAEIYGKARVQGTLFAEDINQLTGRGINVLSQFASILGTTPDQVKKLASEGMVTFPMLEQAFRNLTNEGGTFHGMMAKQSQSIAGLWSTLEDSIGMALTALGTPINDALRPLLKQAVELANGLSGKASEFGERIATAIDFIRAGMQSLSSSEAMEALRKGLEWAFKSALDLYIRGYTTVIKMLSNGAFLEALGHKFKVIALVIKDALLSGVADVMRAMSQIGLIGNQFNKSADSIDFAVADNKAGIEAEEAARKAAGKQDPGRMFLDQFAKQKGIFGEDLKSLEFELGALFAEMKDKASILTAERLAAKDKASAPVSPANSDSLIAGAASRGGGSSVVGAFQRAVNLIGGGTVNELIAAEQMKTNALMAAVQSNTADTKRAAEQTARNTAKGPVVTVNVQPTF